MKSLLCFHISQGHYCWPTDKQWGIRGAMVCECACPAGAAWELTGKRQGWGCWGWADISAGSGAERQARASESWGRGWQMACLSAGLSRRSVSLHLCLSQCLVLDSRYELQWPTWLSVLPKHFTSPKDSRTLIDQSSQDTLIFPCLAISCISEPYSTY